MMTREASSLKKLFWGGGDVLLLIPNKHIIIMGISSFLKADKIQEFQDPSQGCRTVQRLEFHKQNHIHKDHKTVRELIPVRDNRSELQAAARCFYSRDLFFWLARSLIEHLCSALFYTCWLLGLGDLTLSSSSDCSNCSGVSVFNQSPASGDSWFCISWDCQSTDLAGGACL